MHNFFLDKRNKAGKANSDPGAGCPIRACFQGGIGGLEKTVLALLLLFALAGCGAESAAGSSDQPQTATVYAMDTVMNLQVYGGSEVLDQAETLITDLEGALSVTDEGSEIYALNHTGSASLSEAPRALLGQALALCRRTDGALDVSIYPLVQAWGFTTGAYAVPSEEELSALLELVDYRKVDLDAANGQVTLPEGMEIDLGSVAKGYTGDRLMELFQEKGVTSALVSLGGNVQALGSKPDGSPWRVAVQDPQGDGYLCVLDIENQAVITSGGYERYFEQDGQVYWHILDPETGKPAKNGLLSVTIVGGSGLLCDAFSTALFVMGPEAAADFWRASEDFEAVLVGEDGHITLTEGLADRFTLAEGHEDTEVTVLSRD